MAGWDDRFAQLRDGLATAGSDGGGEGRLLPQARLSGPMPWVIAIMIALTVIAAACGLALRRAASGAGADLANALTVQVIHAAPAERTRQVRAALTALDAAPDVAEAREVPQAELERLIEPWLGARSGDEADALPIPALIDVRLALPATPARVAALREALRPVAPAARVDAQSGWLAPVFGAIGALQWLASGLIALLAGATAAAVVLAVRYALGAHHETIAVIHMLGGADTQIARLVQRSVAFDAAVGAGAGLGLGLVVIWLLARRFAALGTGLAQAGGLAWTDWALILLAPALGVALAVLTARLTVLAALRRIL